jgi:hypothetical protein
MITELLVKFNKLWTAPTLDEINGLLNAIDSIKVKGKPSLLDHRILT